ncbi:MAG TPA: HD domain-containing protein [Fastidiosipila sp.]|nr:HD domain-containing protein [Fastidiosipila sp.]
MNVRARKEQFEEKALARTAQLSKNSRGRVTPEAECDVRTVYERDVGRILYSLPFRRLRHKTQVFFNPQNDHICTRMEHVMYVAYLAETIGRALFLNTDLIRAIAYGHDLGHPPFGHAGERVINEIVREGDGDFVFQHEAHSLRVVTRLADHNGKAGLNLTYEVLDGIASHCGEIYSEFSLVPNRAKPIEEIFDPPSDHPLPMTLEGCLVRMVDRIAYVGRDIEDARRAGLMSFEDVPDEIRQMLGRTNSEIVNRLVSDVIEESTGHDRIQMSVPIGEALEQLIHLNVDQIYRSKQIDRYEKMAESILRGLYEAFVPLVGSTPSRNDRMGRARIADFHDFIAKHPEPDASPLRLVTDYVAGMSDHFARAVFDDLYLV